MPAEQSTDSAHPLPGADTNATQEADSLLSSIGTAQALTPEQSAEAWAAIGPLLNDWSTRCHEHQRANYEAAHIYGSDSVCLGVPVVVLNAIVGTGLFAAYAKIAGPAWLHYVIGFFSVATTSLAAVQSFLRYGEKSEKHRSAASQYGAAKRDIDAELALPEAMRIDLRRFLSGIASRLDAIERDAPDVTDRIYRKLRKRKADGHGEARG